MSNPLGFVLPAASLGLSALLIKPHRGFFSPAKPTKTDYSGAPITAQAVIEETHHDELEITDHPVEMGATISDHAYRRPSEVIIHCVWSNSPSKSGGIISQAVGAAEALLPAARAITGIANFANAASSVLSGNSAKGVTDIYQQLLALQGSRLLFDIYTGKRHYSNMLFRSLTLNTDKAKENALWVTAVCREVIIVTTQSVVVPINVNAQAQPQKTTPLQNMGTQQLLKAAGINLLVPAPAQRLLKFAGVTL